MYYNLPGTPLKFSFSDDVVRHRSRPSKRSSPWQLSCFLPTTDQFISWSLYNHIFISKTKFEIQFNNTIFCLRKVLKKKKRIIVQAKPTFVVDLLSWSEIEKWQFCPCQEAVIAVGGSFELRGWSCRTRNQTVRCREGSCASNCSTCGCSPNSRRGYNL